MTKIAVVDDDPVLLARLTKMVAMQDNWECILQAQSLGSFFEKIDTSTPPDIILLDIQLQEINSLQHLDKIKKMLPDTKIIIMTGYMQDNYVLDALRGGADSYIIKGCKPAEVISAIRDTLNNGSYLGSGAAKAVVSHLRTSNNTDFSSTISIAQETAIADVLSPREWEVAKLLVEGMPYKGIAGQFFISINTVRHHVKTIYRKLGVKTKIQLQKKLRVM